MKLTPRWIFVQDSPTAQQAMMITIGGGQQCMSSALSQRREKVLSSRRTFTDCGLTHCLHLSYLSSYPTNTTTSTRSYSALRTFFLAPVTFYQSLFFSWIVMPCSEHNCGRGESGTFSVYFLSFVPAAAALLVLLVPRKPNHEEAEDER